MPVLYTLTNYSYFFLCFLSYLHAKEYLNSLFYLTFFINLFNLFLSYIWLIYPQLTSLIFWSNILNFCSFVTWYFQIYEFINYFLFLIIILNLFNSFFIFIYLLKQKSTINLEKTILLYKKIFLYSHVPILSGLFSFGLIFVNDKEILNLPSEEWIEFLKGQNQNLKETELKVIITKDFGLVRKIEIISLKDQNMLLQLSLEKNLCVRITNFCKSVNYVRFYY